MKKLLYLLIAFVLFSSHDMFLKLDTYFLQPNSATTIQLFNGTFDSSENIIARNRMVDVSLVVNGNRIQVDTTQWRESDGITMLDFKTGDEGTGVAGVSTRPRNLAMTAKDFNEYLEHDGVLDMLDWRKQHHTLDQDAVEKYSKHVKTIFQVGDRKTGDWQTTLGYPIEFIPFSNPYDLELGDTIHFELLWQGEPLANQIVYVGLQGRAHSHDPDHPEEAHQHSFVTSVRTNAYGLLSVVITEDGFWYLRTIYLTESEEAGLTHESNWATLTFEVGRESSHADGDHHAGEQPLGSNIPEYAYWIASLALIVGLFFYFNRQH